MRVRPRTSSRSTVRTYSLLRLIIRHAKSLTERTNSSRGYPSRPFPRQVPTAVRFPHQFSCDCIVLSRFFSAIIHYQPERDDCAVVKKDQVCFPFDHPFSAAIHTNVSARQIYLCDSGGEKPPPALPGLGLCSNYLQAQYLDGTTDVTRTYVCPLPPSSFLCS